MTRTSSLLSTQLGRRRVLVAAFSTTLGAAFLAACGDDDTRTSSSSGAKTLYAAIRSYENVPDPADAGRQVADTFVPQVTGIDGFAAYFFVDTGAGTMVSVTVCGDKAGADESVTLARKWVEDHPGVIPPVKAVVEGSVVATA